MLDAKEPVYFRIICAGSWRVEVGTLMGYSETPHVVEVLGFLENKALSRVSLKHS